MKITVYCSSRSDLGEDYENTAILTGEIIGKLDCTLVFGGVDAGMMHLVAESAHRHGAHIIGVVPEIFAHRSDKLLSQTIITQDLSERKNVLMGEADLFIVLPGGLGTMDEWLTTLAQLEITRDEHRKIIVVNINGMYDSILAQLESTAYSKFARSENFLGINIVANSEDEYLNILTSIIQKHEKK